MRAFAIACLSALVSLWESLPFLTISCSSPLRWRSPNRLQEFRGYPKYVEPRQNMQTWFRR
jgi:hypothetical protein